MMIAADGQPVATAPPPDAATATIAAVTATPFRLRYARAISLSDGVRDSAEQVLVAVTTSEGVVGWGECIPRPGIYGETTSGACTMIEEVLAPRMIGTHVSDLQLLASRLAAVKANPAARASIEIAAFDAFSRTLGLPAHRLLGGAATGVPCAAILAYAEPEVVVAEASALRHSHGVSSFKLKIGGSPARDAALARALRAELGDDATIYADANGRYTTAEAAQFLRLTSEVGLWALEEPTAPADIGGRVRLAAITGVPIMGDETCADVRAAASELAAGRCTAVSIKLARTGIVGSTRIREHCGALGVPVAIGTQADSAIGAYTAGAFAAASPITASGPAELLFFQAFDNNLVTDLPEIRGGRLWPSDRPGFGFEIDHDTLEEAKLR